ncbi:MAG TPA: GNAT family N-acetyltransferase [Solirubrobacteraceae bacterium]|nr:GNAT family N-acetyltransferase [Solirubrobacteraceae bacterium]
MIRPRRSEDFESCLDLLHAVHVADRYPVLWPRDPARWLTGRAGLAAWVSDSAGAIEGHLSLHGADSARARPEWREAFPMPPEQLAVVSRFFVALQARRRGVGSALMDAAEGYGADHGLRLVLDVADHNADAIAFYERRGWRRVGTASLLLEDGRTTLPLVVFVLG